MGRRVHLLAEAGVTAGVVTALQDRVAEAYGVEVRSGPPLEVPPDAWDGRRRQSDVTALLRHLAAAAPAEGWVLAVTLRDLFVPMLTFVFGQAQLGGRLAAISLARLDQRFYGLPSDGRLLAARAVKEANHELGHVAGLVHCHEPRCVMSLSTNVQEVDRKDGRPCEACHARRVASPPPPRTGDATAPHRRSPRE